MDVQYLNKLIDEKQNELFEQLSKLIRINSENFNTHGNEKPCAEYIYELCKELGLESDLYSPMDIEGFAQHPDYVPGRNLENRPNVTARWKGAADVDELMLMGHSDTVPIGNPAGWFCDPLGGEIRDGKVWGRGACDDKYALATCLFLIKLLKENGFEPKANLLFTAYCDEEGGGSHGALAAGLKYPCNRIVNMDGKSKQIWHCASGGQEAVYQYHVNEPLDSAERTAEALHVVLQVMKKFGQRRRAELEANSNYDGTVYPSTSFRYNEVGAAINGAAPNVGYLRFTYYTDKTKDVIMQEFAELDAELTEKLAPLGIISDGFTSATRFFHYGCCPKDCDEILDMVAAGKEAADREPTVCGSCLSDLSVILKYGSPKAFAFGEGRNFADEGGAHQPNEFIECDKLLAYTKTIGAYILKVLG